VDDSLPKTSKMVLNEFPWGHNRRFNSYSEYFKKKFGTRVQKLSIDAGFTCPNRDGTLASGGCTYCNNNAFNPSYCHPEKSVAQQIREGMEFHSNRYKRAEKYLAYFQAFSNTYASLETLKKLYSQTLDFNEIVGIVIGTRPDCINEEKLAYFSKLNEKIYMIIEYGVESCYNSTLVKINRGHSFEDAKKAIILTSKYGINVGAHIIFGLPGETKNQMLDQAKILSELPLNTIKFHQLQIIKGTALENEFKSNPENFKFFDLDEYIDFVVDFTELLNHNIVIERFAGEVPPRFLAGPGWGLIRNDQLLVKIEKKLKERNTWQGKYYKLT